jgi:hypothetical protein
MSAFTEEQRSELRQICQQQLRSDLPAHMSEHMKAFVSIVDFEPVKLQVQSAADFLSGENQTENLRIKLTELRRDILVENKKMANDLIIDSGAKTNARMQQLFD